MRAFEVQARSHDGNLRFFPSVAKTMEYAETDPEVWKISFPLDNGERVRLIRNDEQWIYEPVSTERR